MFYFRTVRLLSLSETTLKSASRSSPQKFPPYRVYYLHTNFSLCLRWILMLLMIYNFFNRLDSWIRINISGYFHHSWRPLNWLFLGLFVHFESVHIEMLWYFIYEILDAYDFFKLFILIFIHFVILKYAEFLFILLLHSYILVVEFLFYVLNSLFVFITFIQSEVCQRAFIRTILLILV